MSDPHPDAEREGFDYDDDGDRDWMRKKQQEDEMLKPTPLATPRRADGTKPTPKEFLQLFKEWNRIVYSQYRQAWDICEVARFKSDRFRLEEIRKAGEVAGWLLQDLDYEEKKNG